MADVATIIDIDELDPEEAIDALEVSDEQPQPTPGFDDNLAENISEQDLLKIGAELDQLWHADRNSRAEWEEKYKKGLKVMDMVTLYTARHTNMLKDKHRERDYMELVTWELVTSELMERRQLGGEKKQLSSQKSVPTENGMSEMIKLLIKILILVLCMVNRSTA